MLRPAGVLGALSQYARARLGRGEIRRLAMDRMKAFCAILLGILREIGDETAYDRHLASHGRAHSAEEYRRFAECRLRLKYQRAKCC